MRSGNGAASSSDSVACGPRSALRCSVRERSAGPETHDRDVAIGLVLILGEARALACDPLPRGRAFLAAERLRRRGGFAALDLDLDPVGMGSEVVEPRWVPGRSVGRRDD